MCQNSWVYPRGGGRKEETWISSRAWAIWIQFWVYISQPWLLFWILHCLISIFRSAWVAPLCIRYTFLRNELMLIVCSLRFAWSDFRGPSWLDGRGLEVLGASSWISLLCLPISLASKNSQGRACSLFCSSALLTEGIIRDSKYLNVISSTLIQTMLRLQQETVTSNRHWII